MQKPVLGVLGGLGPLATAYFMQLVIKRTPVKIEQDNIPMIVINDPQIPDRTAHILDTHKPSPVPEMVRVAQTLETSGANYIAIPCNTAHHYFEAVKNSVEVPVLNIVEETVAAIQKSLPSAQRVALLSTRGTRQSQVYEDQLQAAQLSLLAISEQHQKALDTLIYDHVKTNEDVDPYELLELANELKSEADAVIVGCTELSVMYQLLPQGERPFWMVDSLQALADACIAYYFAHKD